MSPVAPRAYIAGPMRGVAKFNFPAFDAVAKELRARGWTVFNPAQHDKVVYPDIESWPGFERGDLSADSPFDLASALRWDFARIIEGDAIVMLPGWVGSSGARDERRIAERTGKTVYLAMVCDDGWSVARDPEQERMAGPRVVIELVKQ